MLGRVLGMQSVAAKNVRCEVSGFRGVESGDQAHVERVRELSHGARTEGCFVAARNDVRAFVAALRVPAHIAVEVVVQLGGSLEGGLLERDVEALDECELPREKFVQLHARDTDGLYVVHDVRVEGEWGSPGFQVDGATGAEEGDGDVAGGRLGGLDAEL
jgi:hypothetical protein